MATNDKAVTFTTPVGRLVWGSLYVPKTKDYYGNPLVVKSGPDIGKPTQRYEFGVAFAKAPGQHWANTEWGKVIWTTGHAAFPGGQASNDDFAWKITDGDSTKPNKKQRRPCDQEGYPGHWVLTFSSQTAPKVCNADGSAFINEPGAVKCGYFVQVFGSVRGNTGESPGIYLNHQVVALSGFGPEIVSSGIDPSQAGFGKSPLPAGASTTPVGGFTPPAAPIPPVPGAPPVPGVPAAPTPPAPPRTPIQPHPGFLQPPGAPAAPSMATPPPPTPPTAPAPPVAREPRMAAHATATYKGYRDAGWTDEQLFAHGLAILN